MRAQQDQEAKLRDIMFNKLTRKGRYIILTNYHKNMKTNTYSNYSSNVNFIKFIAAIMVILSHAFPLSCGTLENEWFQRLTNEQYTMGGIAVCIFFFYSGLLITRSLEKKPAAKKYFSNRIVRIIPPLATVVLISAFIMGPLITSLSPVQYFTSTGTYLYLLNSILVLTHNLPGVFEHNIYLATVNGSLWTLPVEALCYVACFVLFKLKLNEKLPMKILLCLSLLFDIIMLILSKRIYLGMIYSLILPILMFFAGIFYYTFRDSIKMDRRYLLLAILIILVSNFTSTLLVGLYLGFPYILAYAGFAAKQLPDIICNPGKISYGIYLCAFPIQQCLVWGFGGSMNIYLNMILSIPTAMIGGWLLYTLVESKIPVRRQK